MVDSQQTCQIAEQLPSLRRPHRERARGLSSAFGAASKFLGAIPVSKLETIYSSLAAKNVVCLRQ